MHSYGMKRYNFYFEIYYDNKRLVIHLTEKNFHISEKSFSMGENFLYDFEYRHHMDEMGTKRNICHSILKSDQNFRYCLWRIHYAAQNMINKIFRIIWTIN